MYFKFTTLLPAAIAATSALAQQKGWGQCGGIGWTGAITCVDGWSCVYSNPYFSQCLLAPSSSSIPTATTTTTTATSTGCVASNAAGALMPRASGPPIHALDGWAKDTWLQKSKTSSNAILGPAISKGWYLPASTIRLIYGTCPQFLYLNLVDASTSYKPLSFDISAKTTNWNYVGADWAISLNGSTAFITCDTGALYFQTGTELPPGNCTTTRLTTRSDI
ncbi:Fungal cellulose binding domain protein [Ceratobasidium sp. AG-Ba]|nr:Fungal cellulose binding domain protein [Ceratobasidium sp. AG-Ba]